MVSVTINGSIVAQSLCIEESICYTSQLNIIVSADVIGKSIECYYDDSNMATSHAISRYSKTHYMQVRAIN